MEKTTKIMDMTKTLEQRRSKTYNYNAEAEREANVIGLRLIEARKRKKYTLPDVVERLKKYGVSVSRQALSKWENGLTVPNGYQLLALCHALDIKAGLLYFTDSLELTPQEVENKEPELNEEGLAKLAEHKRLLILSGLYKPVPRTNVADIGTVIMKISTLGVSAGTGNILDESNFEEISVPKNEVPKNADFGIQVHGNSMEPVYQDKQIVWVQRCNYLEPGEVGIFEYDGNGYMKLYDERTPGEDVRDYYMTSDGVLRKQPVLVSYNPDYSPIVVSPHATFTIAGRVVK